ncbi:MAG TPA: hypothetical protein QKA14_01140 [Candidatus Megaira endosymbiont of Hartmannula sinica]|nr:hypothetical protein [Candidatus Megaera endosymbiont of Hartmannula sinica]
MSKGICPNIQDEKGFAPLHGVVFVAMFAGGNRKMLDKYVLIIDLLIEKGADINIRESSGTTPLIMSLGNVDIMD